MSNRITSGSNSSNTPVSGCFLFDVGEMVVYEHRTKSSPCKIIERKLEKNYFLSEIWGTDVFINVYVTEQTAELLQGKVKTWYWEDREERLRSVDIEKPVGAVDYASDELSADFLDKNGNVLKTVKAGKSGYAHEIVSGLLQSSR